MIDALGRWATGQAKEFFAVCQVPYAALKGAWIERGRGSRLLVSSTASQVYFTAIEPLPIFLTIAVTCGVVAIVLADALMRPNGLAPHVPTVVAQAIVRELVPIVIAVILVGRSGTAIATELGYMRVNQEVEALEAVGINIDYFLVLPRILGLVLSSLSLVVTMSVAALVGGFLLSHGLNLVAAGLRLEHIMAALTPATMGYALLKALIFGLVIATINCFRGLAVERNFTEIPRANVTGAMHCYLACFFLNAVISVYALLQSL